MRELIRNLKGQHTILLSSHILSEISQTCDRLLVINEGRLVAQGTEKELAVGGASLGRVELEVVGPGERGVGDRALEALRGLGEVKSSKILQEQSGMARIAVEAPSTLRPQIVRALVAANIDLQRIDYGAPELESIFLRLTQGSGGQS